MKPLLLAIILFFPLTVLSSETFSLWIQTSSGKLKTTVSLTSENAQATILIRSPYLGLDSYDSKINFWNQKGFHVVTQSIAGTAQSSGEFQYLSTREIKEAKVTIDWISNQTFSNGEIILFGESYDGFLALAGGINNHPNIKAIIAASAPTHIDLDSFTSGGMVDFALLKYFIDLPSKKRISQNYFKRKVKQLLKAGTSPLKLDDAFTQKNISDWDKIIQEAKNQNFKDRGIFHQLQNIKVPILLMAGELQDQDATDAIHSFEQRKRMLSLPNRPCLTKLVIGDWFHGAQTEFSKGIASQFANDVLNDELDCLYNHQIEYFSKQKKKSKQTKAWQMEFLMKR